MGHQFVKPDCNKFSPTKAVNRYQCWLTQWPRANEIRTKSPAIKRSVRSIVIRALLEIHCATSNWASPVRQCSPANEDAAAVLVSFGRGNRARGQPCEKERWMQPHPPSARVPAPERWDQRE